MSMSYAIFAAGCFWGIQSAFDSIPGVISTTVGYTGGTLPNPSYEQVCSGNTNHVEAVLVNFDSSIVSYNDLLDVFFASHNPTLLNRQGADIGTQYRSAIFYINENQEAAAMKKIQQLNTSGKYATPIVTQLLPETFFYPAEEYHQKYYEKRGIRSYCTKQCDKTILETDWKNKLSPERYHILREKGTEPPFSGKLLSIDKNGVFVCGACGNPIFISQNKFDSNCGWPSFDEAISGSVILSDDFSHNMLRIEVTCAVCNSHLGHLFYDGPTPNKQRYCINSSAMDFIPE